MSVLFERLPTLVPSRKGEQRHRQARAASIERVLRYGYLRLCRRLRGNDACRRYGHV